MLLCYCFISISGFTLGGLLFLTVLAQDNTQHVEAMFFFPTDDDLICLL